jgi:hypothetical protein
MSLLTICEGLAENVGIASPDVVISSPLRAWAEAVSQSQYAAEELARRVDWGDLTEIVTLTGDGTNKQHDLGAGFSRLAKGIAMTGAGGIIRPLTRAEWATLTPVEGIPRYFLLEGQNVTLWPYLATGQVATATTQSKNWCSAGGDAWVSDGDTSLIDEGLLLKGLIVRWRRQKGMDYADYEAEFEAALRDFASFDDRSRL